MAAFNFKIRVASDEERGGRCHGRHGRTACSLPVTHISSYQYVTGKGGRVGTCELTLCREHAEAWAKKRGKDWAVDCKEVSRCRIGTESQPTGACQGFEGEE